MRWLNIFISLLLAASAAQAGEGGTTYWMTEEKDAVVSLSTNKKGELTGRIVWLEEPSPEEDKSEFDINNPDPKLRNRNILGLEIVSGFEKASQNTWKGGKIYDPESGNTYYGKIEFKGDKLEMRGSLDRWSLIGRTAEFTRTTDPDKWEKDEN